MLAVECLGRDVRIHGAITDGKFIASVTLTVERHVLSLADLFEGILTLSAKVCVNTRKLWRGTPHAKRKNR
jgi:hypothetical protein